MRVLLDTCVFSELRSKLCPPQLSQAVAAIDSKDIFLSVISMGEIIKGISLLKAGKKKTELGYWVQTLEKSYTDRVLGIDLEVCRIWGEITAAAQQKGRALHVSDGLIASTALRHGLHVMTRNTSDFEPTGVLLINPWQA